MICLLVLSGVLKSPTIIVLLSISAYKNILKPPHPKNSSLNPGSQSSDHLLIY